MIPNLLFYIIEGIIIIFLVPLGNRLSHQWVQSFTEWQEYEEWRMSEIESIYERLGEWQNVADRIDRGEKPYPNLSDALTRELGALAHAEVKHLESELARLKAEGDTTEKK